MLDSLEDRRLRYVFGIRPYVLDDGTIDILRMNKREYERVIIVQSLLGLILYLFTCRNHCWRQIVMSDEDMVLSPTWKDVRR